MLFRIIRIVIGLVFLAHGLVHLTMFPGAAAAEGGTLIWNGTAQFATALAATEVLGHVLIIAVVIVHVIGGVAVMFRRLLAFAGYLMAGASVLSIAVIWWIWPGLEPDPSNFWRGPVISACFLVLSPVIVLAGRDSSKFAGSLFSRSLFATWGTTADERAEAYACDAWLPDATSSYFRAIDVGASVQTTYYWLGMIRVAPYSYDLLDNHGHQSPQELDKALPPLAAGQQILRLFTVAEAEEGHGFTAKSDGPPPSAVTYRASAAADGKTRIVVKLNAQCASELGAMFLGVTDWIMMRKQLRTLARLSQGAERLTARAS